MSSRSAIIDIEENPNGTIRRVTCILTLDDNADSIAAALLDTSRYADIFPQILSLSDLSNDGKRLVSLVMRYQFYLISARLDLVCALETDATSFVEFQGVRGNVDDFRLRLELKKKGERTVLYVTFMLDASSLSPLFGDQLESHPELEVAALATISLSLAKTLQKLRV